MDTFTVGRSASDTAEQLITMQPYFQSTNRYTWTGNHPDYPSLAAARFNYSIKFRTSKAGNVTHMSHSLQFPLVRNIDGVDSIVGYLRLAGGDHIIPAIATATERAQFHYMLKGLYVENSRPFGSVIVDSMPPL